MPPKKLHLSVAILATVWNQNLSLIFRSWILINPTLLATIFRGDLTKWWK